MDYLVIFTPLSGVRGFYQYLQRCHVIYIDSGLEEEMPAESVPMSSGTLYSPGPQSALHRIPAPLWSQAATKSEANYFAADLLFDDCDLQDFLSVSLPDAARCLGVVRGRNRLSSEQRSAGSHY